MAEPEPLSPREPLLRAPASVLGLIAAIVLAHLARISVDPELGLRILVNFALIPARYLPGAVDPGNLLERAAPFVTHIFLHADFTHLAINCLWLLAFGPIVARRFGGPFFGLFFVLCAIAGAATYLAFNWGAQAPVIGASGAISGLMAAGIRMLGPMNTFRQDARRPLDSIFSRKVLVFTAVWMGANLVAGLTGMGLGSEILHIAWQAHVGGYLAGLFLAGTFDGFHRPTGTDNPPLTA